MKFELYRYFVHRDKSSPFFKEKKLDALAIVRKMFLEKEMTIGQKWIFALQKSFEDLHIFYIAKKKKVEVSGSPEENFATKKIDDWPHISIITNLSDDSKFWQVFAIQKKENDFGTTFSIAKQIQKTMYEYLHSQSITLEFKPITEKWKFRDFYEKNMWSIKEVSFELMAPNLFNWESEAEEATKKIKEKYNGNKLWIKIENKEWKIDINKDDLFIKWAINTAEKWWWNWEIKANKNTFKSWDYTKSLDVKLDSDAVDNLNETSIQLLLNLINQCLGS